MSKYITVKLEVLQQALNALEKVKHSQWDEDSHDGRALITALRAALAQQDRDPFIRVRAQLDQEWSELQHMKRMTQASSSAANRATIADDALQTRWRKAMSATERAHGIGGSSE